MIRANDWVHHRPSGETWIVCGVSSDGQRLVPCGYPFPTVATVSDCDLLKQKGIPQPDNYKKALRENGLDDYVEADNQDVEQVQMQDGYTIGIDMGEPGGEVNDHVKQSADA